MPCDCAAGVALVKRLDNLRVPSVNDDLIDVRTRLAMAVTDLRVRRGLTSAELAVRANLSLTALELVESGEAVDVRLDTLTAIADALNVDVSSLLPKGTRKPS